MFVRFRGFFMAVLVMSVLWGFAGVARGMNHTYTITAPTAATTWMGGSTVTIQWTGGNPSGTVNLSLIDVPAWQVATAIASGIPDSGSYTWTVPANLPAGTYQVYVEDVPRTTWTYGPSFTIVAASPDLAMSKKPQGPVVAGQPVNYDLVVSNVGTAPMPGPITVTDTLVAGLTYVSASGTGWTCSASGSTVTCTHPGPLAAGQSLPPITLTAMVGTQDPVAANCASVAGPNIPGTTLPMDPNPANDKACVDSPVAPGQPDLTIAKKALGALVAGQNGTYEIAVSNVGTAPMPGPITVTDTLMAGLTYVSASGTGWTCSATGSIVTCTHPGPLPAGQSLPPITLTVAVAASAQVAANCASVAGPVDAAGLPMDPNPVNDKSCVDGPVQPNPGKPDLAITKKPLGNLVAGQQGSYQVAVSNVGTGAAPGPIVVTDTLGAGLTFVSATGSGWTCSASGATVTCTHPGPLPAGQSLPPITLTVMVAAQATVVENCAVVKGQGDTNPQNDSTCIGTPVTVKPGVICGVKFNDLNGNGVRDPGEPGLPGWTIVIKDSAGNVVATVTTGPQGRYCVKVKPGTYVVSEVQQTGWTQTAPATPGTYTVTVGSGQTVVGIRFGNTKKKPCCLDFTFPAGKADNFVTSDGPEPASPPPGKPQTYFDQTEVNKAFYHRFVLPQGNCVREATLEVRVKPLGDISPNDSINLYSGTMSQWGAHFGTGYPGTALLPNPWVVSNYGAGQTLTLNLASLPGGGNLIPALHNSRYLDVLIQDDSSVDYMVLRVKFCECQGAADMQEPVTVALTARLDGTTDPAGLPVLYQDNTLYAPAEAFAGPLGIAVAYDPPTAVRPAPAVGIAVAGDPQGQKITLTKVVTMDADVDLPANDRKAGDMDLPYRPVEVQVELWVDNPQAEIRAGGMVLIDPNNPAVRPFMYQGHVMLPVGFVAQSFGMIYNITVNEEGLDAARIAITEQGMPVDRKCPKGQHWDPNKQKCIKN